MRTFSKGASGGFSPRRKAKVTDSLHAYIHTFLTNGCDIGGDLENYIQTYPFENYELVRGHIAFNKFGKRRSLWILLTTSFIMPRRYIYNTIQINPFQTSECMYVCMYVLIYICTFAALGIHWRRWVCWKLWFVYVWKIRDTTKNTGCSTGGTIP